MIMSPEIPRPSLKNTNTRQSMIHTGQGLHHPTKSLNNLCQQCEASLQFLHSLCQQKVFRERLLRNKELCGNGGVLFLAQAILKLNIAPTFEESPTIVAAVSRLKAKVLSILLNLCEAESISYLDEVASSPGSLELAKSVALEVLEILKASLHKSPKLLLDASSNRTFPTGLLRLNAMRLADIFSDDSNFRSYITTCFTKVLTAIFSLPHGDFLSIWCSSELPPREEDATLEYDTFSSAGWVLELSSLKLSDTINLEISLIPSNMPQAAYAHQRTSLFVKVIANLHCFVPNICEEQERNLFLRRFLECMRMDPSKLLPGFAFASGALKAVTVCKNLRSLLSHAESLIPNSLNEEDVQLLRVFFNQLQSLINPADFEENQDIKLEKSMSLDKFSALNITEHQQEAQSTGGSPFPLLRKEPSIVNSRSISQKEEMSENSAFQEEVPLRFRNEQTRGGDVAREDRDKSGGNVYGISREIDRDIQNVETSGSDTSSTRGKIFHGQIVNVEPPKSSEHIKESGIQRVHDDVKVEEKQPRKRKRTIMNDFQMSVIEKALLDEPEMQRNAASLQSWADKLSHHGSEVTPSQLKNWLNNRKARLARAGKDIHVRASMEIDNPLPEKQNAPTLRQSFESPESPGEDNAPSSARSVQSTPRTAQGGNDEAGLADFSGVGSSDCDQRRPGQFVVLADVQGEEIGKGKVYQVQGKWCGKSLAESETCVVDVTELKVDRWARLPYPSETTGTSFNEAETKMGVMRVLWDSNKVFLIRPQ